MYSNRVIAAAIAATQLKQLSFRQASNHLKTKYSVNVPFGSIQNWMAKFKSKKRSLTLKAKSQVEFAYDRLIKQQARAAKNAKTEEKIVEARQQLHQLLEERDSVDEKSKRPGFLCKRLLPNDEPVFDEIEKSAWWRIVMFIEEYSIWKPGDDPLLSGLRRYQDPFHANVLRYVWLQEEPPGSLATEYLIPAEMLRQNYIRRLRNTIK